MSDLDWCRKNKYRWMNDDQFECFEMLCDLFYGSHHVFGTVRPCSSRGIEINERTCNMSTFDFDYLTRGVLMAHDRCIRFSVSPSGPKMLKLVFHKRHKRDGDMSERHPTIEQAIEKFRGAK